MWEISFWLTSQKHNSPTEGERESKRARERERERESEREDEWQYHSLSRWFLCDDQWNGCTRSAAYLFLITQEESWRLYWVGDIALWSVLFTSPINFCGPVADGNIDPGKWKKFKILLVVSVSSSFQRLSTVWCHLADSFSDEHGAHEWNSKDFGKWKFIQHSTSTGGDLLPDMHLHLHSWFDLTTAHLICLTFFFLPLFFYY